MENLIDNPAFNTYAACVAILVIKSFLSGVNTAVTRLKVKKFVNDEDDRVFGDGSGAVPEELAGPAKALRIQRNDTENLPLFFAIGLVYVLVGASPLGATIYFWTFTGARVLHSIFYMAGLQPLRTSAFAVGTLCLIGMSVQTLMAAF